MKYVTPKHVKGGAPLRYWALWWSMIVVADVLFYVLLTPIWMGLRALAWLAEFRARRRRKPARQPVEET